MDMILCRLESVVQTIGEIPLSPEHVQCIKSKVAYIYERLSEKSNKKTSQMFYHAILHAISEIESLLFLPAINHLVLRYKGNYDEKISNKSRKAKSIVKPIEQKLHPLQCTGTDQQLLGKNAVSPASKDESTLCNIDDDDEYWERRRKKAREVLDETSLRFCKKLSCRRESQQSSSMDSNLDKEGNLAKDRSRSTRRISFKLPEKRCEEKYDQQCIDKFWGINDDICEHEDNVGQLGHTICVINCESELKKLTAFLKTKGLRSFHVQQKPKGLAGSKGTWITPPYIPPLEVKYGLPE